MHFIYNILTHLSWFVLQGIACFRPKIRRFVQGRRKSFALLEGGLAPKGRTLWMHVASLGEYEQGLPILEGLRANHPDHQILLTFFSPSGYEVKKDAPLADLVAYLPMDTLANSREFLDLVRPELALFIKYEIWPNYLRELQKRKIPTLLVSARFSKGQIFFRPFGGFMRKSLGAFTHFFVQDRESMELLKGLGHGNVTLGGDSRFDRVVKIAGSDNRLNFMDAFKGRSFTLVAGSSWPEDERILIPYINGCDERIKFVLAPHEIKEEHIAKIEQALTKSSIRYSQREGRALGDAQVLILDTIGLLNKVYSYADVAYVGGGFATGLHNTLEPAVHGIPVIIGPRYGGFREAVELVRLGGLLPVGNQGEFDSVLDRLREGPDLLERTGRINRNYINAQTGATQRILDHIGQFL